MIIKILTSIGIAIAAQETTTPIAPGWYDCVACHESPRYMEEGGTGIQDSDGSILVITAPRGYRDIEGRRVSPAKTPPPLAHRQ